MNRILLTIIALALVWVPASAQTTAMQTCTIATATKPIPTEVRETSGLARGRTNPDVFWTHNDSGNETELFALSTDGTLAARVTIEGAKLSDWEDIEAGPCGDANCLYLADTGDNAERRARITIHEVIEPKLPATTARINRSIVARYSDGPQDAEALFRLPDGELFIVSKGRRKPIAVYQLRNGGANGEATLERVRELFPAPTDERDRVSAATASPNGEWVAIRTYRTLYIFGTQQLLNGGEAAITFSLEPLAEKQGEAVALDDDGKVWLTSEAEQKKDQPTMASLQCTLN